MTVLTLLAATIPLAVTVIGEPRGEGPLLSPRLRLAVPTRGVASNGPKEKKNTSERSVSCGRVRLRGDQPRAGT